MQLIHKNSGFSLVELIVAIAIFVILISGVTYLAVGSYDAFVGKGNNREVERYAQEAIEAMKVIKEKSWKDIVDNATGSNVNVVKNAQGDWTITSGTDTRGAFIRAITIASVERDTSGNIVSSGGTDDPSTKKITVTISATGRANHVVETYLSNWESYRMDQTSWAGSANDDIWTQGQTDYKSATNMTMGAASSIQAN